MTRRRLTNDRWGLETNCFVCEARNDAGLQLEVYADDQREVVEADLCLGNEYSGAPAVVHGGISLAVLDEIQAWAVIAFGQQFGVTVETQATFHLPVWVDHPYRVVGEIVGREEDQLLTTGRIVDPDGEVCVASRSTFQAIGEATAVEWSGREVAPEHRRYLRD